ncbi:ATP-binding cassette domain-containing protein [Halobellus sp. Atlit-38R]|uniref:ABC transporter ATP-binding protein n=1 Tax=Halobellus sp. Atlit-38R TaxID=2282131 RepID=UPI000EF19A8E|nr:betaine/proline/choline family ABC transporter ATP-binding protein [Halobellus sp. Atlit-38R]RLM89355.1 ATP-binding cassette domain-containing protein [Halobellus sp. Atlit-38R]
MSEQILEFDDVTKVYPDGTVAIEEINFSVEEGTTTVFVGPSGCGKTTTLKLVNRLIDCSDGTIRFEGQAIADIDKIDLRRSIGYVIQEIGLFDHMTVGENVGVVPRLLEWDDERIRSRVDELLNLMDLPAEQYRDQYPRNLSGGQRQRVGVARALAADPDVMLMDEPFGALDPITREKLQDEFLELQNQIDKTILFVTHDIDEALKMGDRIAIYNNGGIVQYDTPKEILTNPANEFVENFLGSDRLIKELKFMKVGDVMETDVDVAGLSLTELNDSEHEFARNGEGYLTVDRDNTTHSALTKLYQGNAESVPVTNGDEVVGVITETNLKRTLSS